MENWFNSTVTCAPVTVYPNEREFIEQVVLGANFPWFWQGNQTFNELDYNFVPAEIRPFMNHYNGPYLSHALLHRTEDESKSHLDRKTSDFSAYYEFFIELFHRFMKDNNLLYSKIFRANLNLNWYNGIKHTEPHFDHTWPHNNFIMYLNTCDAGQTIVWPEEFNASFMFPCNQYTAVTFKKQWHAHRYPAPGTRRVVFVVTYI